MAMTCEIRDCGRAATSRENGIRVCDACARGFVSVGCGAVRFGGRWHGVIGARYSDEQVRACPGILGDPGEPADPGSATEDER